MSETVERVAKAIQDTWANGVRQRFSDEYATLMARAAINALLEPTEQQIDAAMGPWASLYPAFPGEKPEPKAGDVATTIYRAMLSTALQTKEPAPS